MQKCCFQQQNQNKDKAETMGEAGQVRVLHLLCKHEKSRNPVSRRTNQSTANVPVSAAHEELKKYAETFKGLEGQPLATKFSEACYERSDCGSFAQGGDLNFFGPGQMQKPFEEASFALKVGEMSGIVDTDSGSHLILRIG
mmetsp:Transcript_8092/g.19571  ORF Transcript_8092/g.19571 Transcript_8092/m.19571 type:complete len:141 (+) Transcript_8092:93-515(+)